MLTRSDLELVRSACYSTASNVQSAEDTRCWTAVGVGKQRVSGDDHETSCSWHTCKHSIIEAACNLCAKAISDTMSHGSIKNGVAEFEHESAAEHHIGSSHRTGISHDKLSESQQVSKQSILVKRLGLCGKSGDQVLALQVAGTNVSF